MTYTASVVRQAAEAGSVGGGSHTVNVSTAIHAVDASGFGRMLDRHHDQIARTVTKALRNRGLVNRGTTRR